MKRKIMKEKQTLWERRGVWLLCLTMTASLLQGVCVRAGEGSRPVQTASSNIVAERGGMPTRGEVKPLVVKVAFPDYPFESEQEGESVYPDETLLTMMNGTEENPLEDREGNSLRSFYAISSYGQLDICCDKIYQYTAQHNREYYSDENTGAVGIARRQQNADIQTETTENNTSSQPVLDVIREDLVQEDKSHTVEQEYLVYGREYRNMPEEEEENLRQYLLLDEMLAALDDEIDYRDYDSDKDGYIDAIYLNFAGPLGDWSTTWWPHVSVRKKSGTFDETGYRAYTFIHYNEGDSYSISSDTRTMIHETGHLLGIPDFYSYDDEQKNMIGSFDIMSTGGITDHNGFSKWTYGWIDEEEIEFVDKERGETTVQLCPVDGVEKDGKMIAVIAPENAAENGIFSQYFLVEYDAGEYLNKDLMSECNFAPGFRIYAVNAVLDEYDGKNYEKNDNWQMGDRLIYDVRSTNVYSFDDTLFREGDSFTPETEPKSHFYSDNSKIGKPTGIVLTDFVTGETPSFKVSFTEVKDITYDVEFTGATEELGNTLGLKIYSNVPLDIVDYEQLYKAYLTDEEGTHYVVNITELPEEERCYLVMYYYPEPALHPNTAYTLVIPKDTFKVTETQNLEEVRIPITTGDFSEAESLERSLITQWWDFETDWVRGGEDTAVKLGGYFATKEEDYKIDLKIVDIHGEETDVKNISLPVLAEEWEYPTDMETVYTEARLFSVKDGTIIAALSYLDRETFYHLDLQGNLLGKPQAVDLSEDRILILSGKHILGTEYDWHYDASTLVKIDFENPVSEVVLDRYVEAFCGMSDEEYATMEWDGERWTIRINDMNDQLKQSFYLEDRLNCLIYEGDYFYYLAKRYENGEYPDYYIGKMDREGNIIEENNISEDVEELFDIWDDEMLGIEKMENGYMVYGTKKAGYNKIYYVTFFDEAMQVIGHRQFYEGESFVALKSGVFNARSAYLPEEEYPVNFYYRFFCNENNQENTSQGETGTGLPKGNGDGTPEPDAADHKSGQKANHSENGADAHAADLQGTDKGMKTSGNPSTPRTGDDWSYRWLISLGVSGLLAIWMKSKKC